MKRAFVIVSTLLIMVSTMKDIVIVMDYGMNYDFIKENLCINKTKPEVLCSGRCYLNERLSEQHDDDAQTPVQDKLDFRTVFLIPLSDFDIPRNHVEYKKTVFFETILSYPNDWMASLYRPPAMV